VKRIFCLLTVLALCLALTGCGKKEPERVIPNPIATITMEDGRQMRFELMLDEAPNTVANFADLANGGFYDGLEFFRVVPGVFIQAGDPNNDGTGHAGRSIKGEFEKNGVPNRLSHIRGVLSMSRLEGYDTASSQFFILQGNYPEYDGYYAAFGAAMDVETLDVLDSIASQPVDSYYLPLKRQVIDTIRVNTHNEELPLQTTPIEEDKEK